MCTYVLKGIKWFHFDSSISHANCGGPFYVEGLCHQVSASEYYKIPLVWSKCITKRVIGYTCYLDRILFEIGCIMKASSSVL